MSDKAWSGKTGGTKWMQQSLIGLFRHFDPRWVGPIVAIWIWGYILLVPSGRRGMYYYWRQRRGKSRLSACWHTWRSYLGFGMVVMDRFAAYSGREYAIRLVGEEVLCEMQQSDRGAIVLSSHIGNQELAGYSLHSHKPMHVMLYMGDTSTVNENRERMFERMGMHLLPMQADGSHVFAMHQVLERGELLSIHGDRLFYGQRAMRGKILGEEADFPEGPYRVAAAEGVPVITMFMMKECANTYTLYVRKLSDGRPEGMRKPEYAQLLLDRYIAATEEMLNKYPHQWFQFYEFWKKG